MKAQSKRRADVRETRFAVRPLEERDIPQCEEIEREVFPTTFPKTSFRSEYRRPISSYLVVSEASRTKNSPIDAASASEDGGLMEIVADKSRRLFRGFVEQYRDAPTQLLAGMLGIWYMADDAHIVSVAVRERFRGMGVGELLLIEALRQASAKCEGAATLEVRVSNEIAKNLYAKYGFATQGIRKGYYSDNREDAVIMTTDRLRSETYQERLRELAEAHQRRWAWFGHQTA